VTHSNDIKFSSAFAPAVSVSSSPGSRVRAYLTEIVEEEEEEKKKRKF
jgi:hypothetical protein